MWYIIWYDRTEVRYKTLLKWHIDLDESPQWYDEHEDECLQYILETTGKKATELIITDEPSLWWFDDEHDDEMDEREDELLDERQRLEAELHEVELHNHDIEAEVMPEAKNILDEIEAELSDTEDDEDDIEVTVVYEAEALLINEVEVEVDMFIAVQ